MRPEAQHLAIAKAHGWEWQTWGRKEIEVFAPKGSKPDWHGENKETNSMRWPIGNKTPEEMATEFILRTSEKYLTDLNAIHKVEASVFIGPKEWGEYCDMLRWVITQHIENSGGPGSICGIVCLEMAVNATAAQRAEAVLRKLNLWNDTYTP